MPIAFDRQAIRESIDLAALIEPAVPGGLKYESGGKRVGLCPFHSEHTPSFKVWPDGHYRCFGCGEHGDALSFLIDHLNMTFREAVKFATDNAGIRIVRQVKPRLTLVAQSIQQPVPHKEIKKAQSFLKSNAAKITMLTEQRHISPEIIELAELGWSMRDRRFTIPIPHATKPNTYVDCRKYLPGAKDSPKSLPWDTTGRTKQPYILPLESSEYVVLCEGEPDMLASLSAGIPTATNTCGAKSAHDVWKEYRWLLARYDHIVLCFDNDEAGNQAVYGYIDKSERFRPGLLAVFPSAIVVTMPEGMDVTDYITAHGRGEYRGLIESALTAANRRAA